MTCEPIPHVRGFGRPPIPSDVSYPKSYTAIGGGSMLSEAFHSMGCVRVLMGCSGMLQDRLEAARLFLGHIH